MEAGNEPPRPNSTPALINVNINNNLVIGDGKRQLCHENDGEMYEVLPFVDVWDYNLEEEFRRIADVVKDYNYVAMDTEFPGVVFARPACDFQDVGNFRYKVLQVNVNMLKLIQVGLTFMDENGNTPPPDQPSTWQFNFKFDLTQDEHSDQSVAFLKGSGIDFDRLVVHGISSDHFGELLTTSGLVAFDKVKWLSFHSAYDFGYLIRAMYGQEIPSDQQEFYELLRQYFPNVYDVKYMLMASTGSALLNGGLQDIANSLQISRIGVPHQAGSDSLLTGQVFFKLRENYFSSDWHQLKGQMKNRLYGIWTEMEPEELAELPLSSCSSADEKVE